MVLSQQDLDAIRDVMREVLEERAETARQRSAEGRETRQEAIIAAYRKIGAKGEFKTRVIAGLTRTTVAPDGVGWSNGTWSGDADALVASGILENHPDDADRINKRLRIKRARGVCKAS